MKIVLVTKAKVILICTVVAFFLFAPLFVLLLTEGGGDEHGIQILHKETNNAAPDPDHLAFQQFISEYNRDYNTGDGEYQKRFAIFKDNLRYVEQMNAHNLSYTLGITMFSDLTDEEFIEQYATKLTNTKSNVPASTASSPAATTDISAEPIPYMQSSAYVELDTVTEERRRQLKFLGKEENANQRYQREFKRLKYRHHEGLRRYEESVDDVDGLGMDIGDYEFIDSKLIHCPMVDWVKQGKVLARVKNQKKCGSCWAHNTVAAVENLYARYNDIDDPEEIPSLSEQQLVDCDTFPNIGCFGGEAKYAFNYTKNHGLTTSDHYEYLDRQEECRFNPRDDLYDDVGNKMPKTPVEFQIDNFKVYNHVTRHDLEKLACEGVVAVPMRLNKCIKHYISGIIDDSDGLCGCSQIGAPNHAVALVGFGQVQSVVDKSVEDGWRQVEGYSETKCERYWLLRNSWTHRWGEGGYFRLCRDDDELRDGTCFIRHDAVLPVMNKRHYYSRG